MQLIIFEGPRMATEMKRELGRAVVDAVHNVTGHDKEILTLIIHENPPENIAPAGELLIDRPGHGPGD